MPRKKFVLAPDAASREIMCDNYCFNGGSPSCKVLTHPWCLAPGEAPAACKFRVPLDAQTEPEPKTGRKNGKK